MLVRVYDINTQIALFDAKIEETERGAFEQFLTAQGFLYVNHLDKWINKERGHEAIIWE